MQINVRRALVTGSSRGIGRGVAVKLATEGVQVAVHYRSNETAAQETLRLVRSAGSDGVLVRGDVTGPDEVRRIVDDAAARLGGLDVFVSNARPELSDFFAGPHELTLAQWDCALDSQAKAFLVGSRAAAAHMGTGGRIIAITYATGSRTGGLQPWVAMGAAKAALESTVRYLAVAFASQHVTVNALSPAWTEDSVLLTLPTEAQDLIRDWHESGWTPMRRLTRPADVGDAAALLVAEEAGFITGQILHVDGGASLMNAEVPSALQLAGG
jgi:NAD(P)-dependent dehydrogenase (short-subunit alcohol dehydrogenase family)